ncbi:MAG: class I SAM-dependent methyltransferase [Pseudomonadota bacterium]
MLRMKAYHAGIFRNSAEMIADKVVLDVGTGTGVLAVWAAKAGAKHVYAVDASHAHHYAEQLVYSEGVSDKVTVLHAKIEEIDIPQPVDIIISEWMGVFLIKESMFDSVAYARDKWLKPGGLLLPSAATIELGLYTPDKDYDHTDFVRKNLERERMEWKKTVTDLRRLDVDYSALTDELEQELSDHHLKNAIRANYLSADNLAANSQQILAFDCNTVAPTDLIQFSKEFDFTVTRRTEVRGFLGWFTVQFPNGVVLDTGPKPIYNHWGQQLYPLEESLQVAPGDHVTGTIRVQRDPLEPRLNIVEFTYQVGNGPRHTARFNMNTVENMGRGSRSYMFGHGDKA